MNSGPDLRPEQPPLSTHRFKDSMLRATQGEVDAVVQGGPEREAGANAVGPPLLELHAERFRAPAARRTATGPKRVRASKHRGSSSSRDPLGIRRRSRASPNQRRVQGQPRYNRRPSVAARLTLEPNRRVGRPADVERVVQAARCLFPRPALVGDRQSSRRCFQKNQHTAVRIASGITIDPRMTNAVA